MDYGEQEAGGGVRWIKKKQGPYHARALQAMVGNEDLIPQKKKSFIFKRPCYGMFVTEEVANLISILPFSGIIYSHIKKERERTVYQPERECLWHVIM